jgi:peptide chain release factor 1
MRKMLEEKLSRFEELERSMTDPAVQADGGRMANAAREHGSLAKLATKYRKFKALNNEIDELKSALEGDDSEMAELAESELPVTRKKREKLWNELLEETIGGEDAQRTRCVMEIRAGTGGDEAALFARDLYEMYKAYCEKRKWKVEIVNMNATELGGFKELVLNLEGEGVYRDLAYESGGHRVQRVPETEAKGRIHTSAATVAVLPEPEDVEIDLKPDDYEVERYAASSGPGGQHVNKTASAIRVWHKESGIEIKCFEERSQHKNLAKALRYLKTRLYEAKREKEDRERSEERKTLVGSGDRSQRIRTYNYPDNRLTDHRINLTLYKLDQILMGDLDPVVEACRDHDRQQLRDQMGGLD